MDATIIELRAPTYPVRRAIGMTKLGSFRQNACQPLFFELFAHLQ
jgi:hypothetical protein